MDFPRWETQGLPEVPAEGGKSNPSGSIGESDPANHWRREDTAKMKPMMRLYCSLAAFLWLLFSFDTARGQ